MSKTVPMSFRLKPELKAKLQSLADADRRSLTNYLELWLEKHVEEATKARRK
jgi:predicted transcriptional regulator